MDRMTPRPHTQLEIVESAPRVRVVLAARDQRFLRVTSFLLGRKGFFVESTRRPEHLLRVVERHRPDVVILDGMESLAEAARALASIEALRDPVAVLVVTEAPEASSPKNLRLLHKWTAFDKLVEEVERLRASKNGHEETSGGVR